MRWGGHLGVYKAGSKEEARPKKGSCETTRWQGEGAVTTTGEERARGAQREGRKTERERKGTGKERERGVGGATTSWR